MVNSEATTSACFELLDRVLITLGMQDELERRAVRGYCRHQSFEKDELLHRAGDTGAYVYFICNGLVRFYYITDEGKEHNKSFSSEGEFAGAIQYSEQPEPCRFYIQALEPTSALAISLAGLSSLYKSSLAWANLGRLYMETLVVRKTDREASFLLDSAQSRYVTFIRSYPALVKRLPLYHVASYLGITDVALSRVRRRLNKGD